MHPEPVLCDIRSRCDKKLGLATREEPLLCTRGGPRASAKTQSSQHYMRQTNEYSRVYLSKNLFFRLYKDAPVHQRAGKHSFIQMRHHFTLTQLAKMKMLKFRISKCIETEDRLVFALGLREWEDWQLTA